MILIKEKHPLKEPPIEYKSKDPRSNDPWADWTPRWTVKDKAGGTTPHDFQERHAPTRKAPPRQEDSARYNTSPRETRRRLVDARLWDAMTFSQQDAAGHIAAAFEMIGRGLGYATSNWQRIPGCKGAGNVSEAHGRMINAYTLWARECAIKKISHALVIDVLCYGFSCRMIDCDRRLKHGAARENLMKGLTLYCRLQGWR